MDDSVIGEMAWWGNCADTSCEEEKQQVYARYMGLLDYRASRFAPFDLGGQSVLDIGGGPVSLLLKCSNVNGIVLDPAEWPQWVMDRYADAGISYIRQPAEDAELSGMFDEVWLYNCLQHVRDPQKVVDLARRHGRTVRVFEWLHTATDTLHPHTFTRERLDALFGTCGRVVDVTPDLTWATSVPPAWTAVIHSQPGEPDVRQMRFHLLGLAHIPTAKEYSNCAYTQKIVKLGTMLRGLGHELLFYGTEGSQVDCGEFVQVSSEQDRIDTYGEYDWRSGFFKQDYADHAHQVFNANAIEAINSRKRDGDILLVPNGTDQRAIADAVGLTTVESGIGYRGVFAPYKVFESYAWMHYIYGLNGVQDGAWYDAVIPNYFDPADFPMGDHDGDYYLFIGRLIHRKGLDVAVQATKALGARLIVAGQGSLINPNERLNITEPHVEHVGSVGPERRAELMGGATAVFAPTYYIEPFGGVAVEAQMCGTPVIASDWGAFPETIRHGQTGYRCRTLEQFVWAARNAQRLDPFTIRRWAVGNYGMDRVRWMYQEYFEQVDDVRRRGWYEPRPRRRELDWLEKRYP